MSPDWPLKAILLVSSTKRVAGGGIIWSRTTLKKSEIPELKIKRFSGPLRNRRFVNSLYNFGPKEKRNAYRCLDANGEGDEGLEILYDVEAFENSNPRWVAAGELYQADMLLTEEQWASFRLRKAIVGENFRWTEGSDGYPLVPYVFQDSVDRNDVRAGLDHWMEHTCIRFEETINIDQPHLQFFIGGGCFSFVGMVFQNGQTISIGQGCNSLGIVVHEVGHALGFFHEQSRSDRDDYVIILFDNVIDGRQNNFNKATEKHYDVLYDYSSNMHYGQFFFSKNNKPTVVTIDPLAQELIGSRNGLTHRDTLLANIMYNCIEKWLIKCGISSDPCLNEGYTGKDCTCICPPGTTGHYCEQIVHDYYAQLRNNQSEKIVTEKSITVESPLEIGTSIFVKWIVPPTCTTAKVTFTSIRLFTGDCKFQFLNVRTSSSDIEGQVLCSTNVSVGDTLTSDTGIIITMTNFVNYGNSQLILWSADVTFDIIPGCTPTPTPTTTHTPTHTTTPTPTPTTTPTPTPTTTPTPTPTTTPTPTPTTTPTPTPTTTPT
ncbi:unnamed protein product, partial [Meganyctiphanes norvegica]